MPRYVRATDLDNWLKDPRIAARGFVHRWESEVSAGNGEDAFIEQLDALVRPDTDILDVGCGHGELTLGLAARCRSAVGIERDPGLVGLAQELAAERGVQNVRFVQARLASRDEQGPGAVGIPLPDNSIDLFTNRRGPILDRYLNEAIRVARPGAVVLGLHPTGNAPVPDWRGELPEAFQNEFGALSFEEVAAWVIEPLTKAGITDYQVRWIDVPEYFRAPCEVYARLSWMDASRFPPYSEVESTFEAVHRRYAGPKGLVLRHQRLLWQARLR